MESDALDAAGSPSNAVPVERSALAAGVREQLNLRGKVVVMHAYQMLCPGCVAHGTPQAEKLHQMSAKSGDVVAIGLDTVFEHHAAMTEVALAAFIHEYRLTLPIAVDRPGDDGSIPQTMQRYGRRGTPTTIAIDRDGRFASTPLGRSTTLRLGFS